MPTRALQPCRRPRCIALVASGYCDAHRPAPLPRGWSGKRDARPSERARGYDGKWEAIRRAVLASTPLCPCGARATDVDHVVPLRQGGTHARGNLRALCHPCHSRRTAGDVNCSRGVGGPASLQPIGAATGTGWTRARPQVSTERGTTSWEHGDRSVRAENSGSSKATRASVRCRRPGVGLRTCSRGGSPSPSARRRHRSAGPRRTSRTWRVRSGGASCRCSPAW